MSPLTVCTSSMDCFSSFPKSVSPVERKLLISCFSVEEKVKGKKKMCHYMFSCGKKGGYRKRIGFIVENQCYILCTSSYTLRLRLGSRCYLFASMPVENITYFSEFSNPLEHMQSPFSRFKYM